MTDEFVENFKADEQCLCCNEVRDGFVCYHHLLTQKAYGEFRYKKWNKAPVCLLHHNMWHNSGTSKMKDKFPRVESWLVNNGWYLNTIGKWWNENATAGQ